MEFLCPAKSAIPGTIFYTQGGSSYQIVTTSSALVSTQNSVNSFTAMRHPVAYQSYCLSGYLDDQNPDNGTLDYDDDEVRLKLQELENALLNDNDDDDDVFGMDQNMDIDGEWTDPIKDLLFINSPKESSSSDSNLSGTSSNKKVPEMPMIPPICPPHSSRTPTPKQLLFDCAVAISEGNMEEASAMITELRRVVSIQGDPSQRIAAYMVEGLAARMAASGKGLYKALKCKEPPSSDRLSAMQVLFEVCPYFKFGVMAANTAIAEAIKDERRVHIIDFDINQGTQYIQLLQALAIQPSKPQNIKITVVDDPESVQRAVGGLKVIGQRLENLAEAVKLPFEFRALAAKTADVTPSKLDCQPGEAVIVNFSFQLHHMPDESVSTVNQRDQLLRMVKSLNPKLVTVIEQDMNANTAPFFPRFIEAYNYYTAVFNSLDATLPRESPDRMNVERQCLARDIVNIVACEGEDRIERYEVAGKWRARMMMAGFTSCPLSAYVNETVQKLLKQYCDRYTVKKEEGALHFGWEDKMLIVSSAWR
ncbi:PREDICTED: scarecrow-like protein 1 [Nelumbo nucifera]|uniref:Scarecrow-like protein 1 n=2 Tax=Nelumbo nucifera TaxID=4432 RepID=A0A1U8A0Q6_NELNU|nr:PREDICTED: scarecrow-like protein 1 [Nelumbo nucifera]DAD22672.1 TPA_asm: hypothetical protein HUJ06_024135 [Nelumbo nucifera]